MRRFLALIPLLFLTACDMDVTEGVDQMFGEQHFGSAIAVIELHKTRYGVYPDTLDDLRFLGEWDGIWIQSVDYEKTETGYNLFITRGWAGEPTLVLPEDYRTGLGLEETNVLWVVVD